MTEETTNEIWKTIDGYPGYQVSSIGRVKSIQRKVKYKNGSYHTVNEKIIKPGKDKNGYLIVGLYKENKRKNMKVHRLVAAAFVQNDSLFNTEINHIDECKTNNCASNLEWCEHSYNCNFGTRNIRVAKLQSKKVLCLETGVIYSSTRDIERKFGFYHNNISKCCNKKIKSCGGLHWEWAE